MLRHPDAALEYGPAVRVAPQHGRILQRIAVQDEQVGDRARRIRPRSSRPSSSALTEVAALSSASGPSTSACSRSQSGLTGGGDL